jgi:diaminopimelate decarboxylase
MDPTQTLIKENFSTSNGELVIGDIPVSAIAQELGTPLFVYDRQRIEQKLSALRTALPREFSIFYSVKANPNRALLQLFVSKGCGLEIASAGELRQALHAGCPAGKIIFAGPGKTDAELHEVIEQGIGEIHVESAYEARRIAQISQKLGVRSSISVRVNPSGEAQGGAMRMGGKPAPFGIDEEQLDEALDYIFAEPALEVRGIHLFTGTQILDYQTLLTQYRKGIEIARKVAARMDGPLRTLDFGGGLGIPYFAGESELDLESFSQGLRSLMGELHDDRIFAGTEFVTEPGRFLVGDSGLYLMRIVDVKLSRGKKFYICDGGMHHHLAASGNLGQTIKRNFPIAVVNRLDDSELEAVDVVGPLCTPLDVLGRSVALPKAEPGDLIGIFQSGAYARSASPLGFLSHATPAEALVNKGTLTLIRQRGEHTDYERDLCDSTQEVRTPLVR